MKALLLASLASTFFAGQASAMCMPLEQFLSVAKERYGEAPKFIAGTDGGKGMVIMFNEEKNTFTIATVEEIGANEKVKLACVIISGGALTPFTGGELPTTKGT